MKFRVSVVVGRDKLVREYETPMPAEAMRRFWEEVCEPGKIRRIEHCSQVAEVAPKDMEEPFPWEKEKSPLSTMQARLEWEPNYCTHIKEDLFCPYCGSELEERWGKYGKYYQCSCGKSLSQMNPDWDKVGRVASFCGTRLIACLKGKVAKAVCPKCNKT